MILLKICWKLVNIFFLLISCIFAFSCNETKVPDFSCDHLDTVDVWENNGVIKYNLNAKQKCILSQLLLNRKEGFLDHKENLNYDVFISFKKSDTFLHYETDGIYFQGLDQSTCYPFAFTIDSNLFSAIK